MRCLKCNSDKLSVIETRSDVASIRRRRACQDCGFRFSTQERLELNLPIVVKKDGRREAFKSDKIRQGLIRACQKRPVDLDAIDKTVAEIEQKVAELDLKEVNSNQIGIFVLEALRNLDKVAFMRFVSVYHEFSDLNQFQETLQGLAED